MSLKVFHILFIILCTLLAAGCAAWGYASEMAAPFYIISAVIAVGLIAYGCWFIRKSRRIIT